MFCCLFVFLFVCFLETKKILSSHVVIAVSGLPFFVFGDGVLVPLAHKGAEGHFINAVQACMALRLRVVVILAVVHGRGLFNKAACQAAKEGKRDDKATFVDNGDSGEDADALCYFAGGLVVGNAFQGVGESVTICNRFIIAGRFCRCVGGIGDFTAVE